MKISRIFLKNIQQFKNLEIELTYPKGHAKEGQPLDKVCFIGQSGTGKTTLLRLIKSIGRTNLLDSWNEISDGIDVSANSYFEAEHVYRNFKYTSSLESPYGENDVWERKVIKWKNYFVNDKALEVIPGISLSGPLSKEDPILYKSFFRPNKIDVIYFPVGFHFNSLNVSPIVSRSMDDRSLYQTLDFGYHNVKLLWYEIQNVLKQYSDELASLLYNANAAKLDREKKLKEFDEWELSHPSLLKEIGDRYLNAILQKFQLKVDDKVDPITLNNYTFIPIRHLNDEKNIGYNLINSASQNIIYTSVPLFFYEPTDSIILIDEVENSLYPDVQTKIVEDYINIAKGNQFFFSTHSPLIASTFDPWEIVELKFDDEGNIFQDSYLKDSAKGRHVDNYLFDPHLISYGAALRRIFDTSDFPPQGKQKLVELAGIEERIKIKRKNGDSLDTIRPLVEEYKKIAQSIDWEV